SAGVSLAIAGLILIKQNKFEDAKKLIDETKKKLSGLGKSFSEAFAVTLIEYIIDLKRSQNEKKYKDAIKHSEDLPLFDEELSLVKDLIGEKYKEETTTIETSNNLISETQENKLILSREDIGEKSKIQIDLNQRYGKIQAKAGDAKRSQNQILRRRGPYMRRYFAPIIELLKLKKFKEAAEEYLKLGNKFFSKIKDFEISSLMMALHGLTLLKTGQPLKLVKTNLSAYLNSLGVNKKLVQETFYIMLIMFLIDMKIYNFDHYLPKIKEMVELLPLFEEEKVLIQI
ncbi:MAG: hypothetical protein R3255_09835, partial [Candidatus Lokiarchaeia archaeon]|nr:hypothetical protein [Candidatus Lokiarchaeia archaeon]